jgi:hypothetical protein
MKKNEGTYWNFNKDFYKKDSFEGPSKGEQLSAYG